ncbi:hypothetical protein BAAM0499_03975 [Bifidobacterium animalis subsp. animalis MCC 0499]|uniref:hypothetical protein n=1 Tax=Bifidobacterium animalis TaxID=28025 RepID=UPI00069B6EED|nr:hypothetical protein [Bifidobacterium animalis]KOA61035.1 hypothetical protein BAAM0499_03975 [Bifidobacterium animalis subsp. animalis MCC 0499]
MVSKTMPKWMQTRLTRQTRRTVSWEDQPTHVEKDGEYLLLRLQSNGDYEQYRVTAKLNSSYGYYELRARAGWILNVSKTGVLAPDTTSNERPIAVLLNPNAYHMVTVLTHCGLNGTGSTQLLYTQIAYDTPAQGFVTVTTLFGTTITIPVTQIASIE